MKHYYYAIAERGEGGTWWIKGVASRRVKADQFAANVLPVIRQIQGTGATTLAELADALNARGMAVAQGGRWHAMSVRNVLARGRGGARDGFGGDADRWPAGLSMSLQVRHIGLVGQTISVVCAISGRRASSCLLKTAVQYTALAPFYSREILFTSLFVCSSRPFVGRCLPAMLIAAVHYSMSHDAQMITCRPDGDGVAGPAD